MLLKQSQVFREYRISSGLSQAQVARELKYKNQQSISNIENGVHGIPADKIQKVKRLLAIPPQLLINAIVADARIDAIRLVKGRTEW